MEKLVAMYEKGAITADHLVAECLHLIDPQCPDRVLGASHLKSWRECSNWQTSTDLGVCDQTTDPNPLQARSRLQSIGSKPKSKRDDDRRNASG